jgi:hypothetical protein
MTEITDKLWTQNIDIIFQKDRLYEIYPTDDMTNSEKLNSLFRLSIYVGVSFAILFSNYLYLYVPLIMAFIQIGITHYNKSLIENNNNNDNNNNNNNNNIQSTNLIEESEEASLDKIKEKYQNTDDRSRIIGEQSTCVRPSEENPFMNPLIYDSRYRQPACTSYDNNTVKSEIDQFFDNNLFKDSSDIYDNRQSQRQFFTMPYTTFPNDQNGFAMWAYGEPPTCKEGNGIQCVANNYDKLQGNSYKMI